MEYEVAIYVTSYIFTKETAFEYPHVDVYNESINNYIYTSVEYSIDSYV